MTGGKYKTFTNNPMGTGKVCVNYTHSNCPGSCVQNVFQALVVSLGLKME